MIALISGRTSVIKTKDRPEVFRFNVCCAICVAPGSSRCELIIRLYYKLIIVNGKYGFIFF
jgi:hypothetical protein